MSEGCNKGEKLLGIMLVPATPFEAGMSIATWEEKRAENAEKAIENKDYIIIDDPIGGEVDKAKVNDYYRKTILKRKR